MENHNEPYKTKDKKEKRRKPKYILSGNYLVKTYYSVSAFN
jgi:hypothetical protein